MTALAPYQRHSATSLAAAKSVHGKKQTQEELVYAAIREHGPVSDERLGELLNLAGDSVRPRRVALMNGGRIRQQGEGRTARNKRCALWVSAGTPEQLGLL